MPDSAAVEAVLPEPARALGVTDELLAACVHCGFCIPVCPTWDILREENDSPRGRLYLMRAEAEGRVDPAGAVSIHLDRCLGCRACESVCPAGVPFGHLLERARARIPARPEARRRERWVLSALTSPGLARITYTVARFLRTAGLANAVGRLLPGKAGQLLRLLAATRPTFARTRVFEPVDPRSDDRGRDAAKDEGSYVLLTGCVMNGLFAHVHASTRRTLARAGYREVEAPGQTCCGALHAHAGLLVEAREQARRNIEVFEQADCEWIVTDSAGCGAGLKDYPAWFADEPEWQERAVFLARRVRDITEILASVRLFFELDVGREHSARLEGRVGYDAPCHLQHGQGIQKEPLDVLRAIPGLEVEALPSSDRCCGGAGMYNLAKLGEARRGGFDWIATGNPGCIMYLGAGLLHSGDRTPVVHPVELVDRAWS